jgi:DNA-binding transcriptional regulator LsrR (DeoR family)
MALHGQDIAAAEIAHRLEISRASVYRVLEDAEGKTEVKCKVRSASVYLEAA